MKKAGSAAVISLALSGALAAAGEAPQKVETIPNYVRINPGVVSAGQPSAQDLARMKELGFGTVINLRTAGEPGFFKEEEEAALAAQGIRYVHVPITPATFSAADVAAVRAVLDDPKAGPVLMHCGSANRVGGVWAAVLAARGQPLEDALAEGRRAGLLSEAMTAAVRRVASPSPAP